MASSDSPATAKGNADAAIYDVDSVMATTLAALGNPSIPYKKMAAVDPKKRTEFAWQHRFRKWRSAAKDLMSAHPEVLEGGIVTPSTCATKKTPASKRKSAQKVDDATDDNEINSGTEDGVRKNPKKRGANKKSCDEPAAKKPKAANVKKVPPKTKSNGTSIKAEEDSENNDEDNKSEKGVEMQFEEGV